MKEESVKRTLLLLRRCDELRLAFAARLLLIVIGGARN